MKKCILLIVLLISNLSFTQNDTILPMGRNKEVVETVEKYGPSISPTYEQAVCTELVIGVLEKLITLTPEDKKLIRIITDKDIYNQKIEGSKIPKGVYHALTENGKGIAVENITDVRAGDFVQFWYPYSWGHCGIVHSIDLTTKKMKLYSSFPSTDGYGIQEFDIPKYCYYVRLIAPN